MRAQRSMVFYAWLGLVVEFVLVLGVVAFVLAGAGYQRSAILLLTQRVQHMQLVNLTLQGDFLNTQRALRGYQATGQSRFAQTYYSGQADFVYELVVLRRLAWPGVLDGVTAQERAARAAFLRGGEALVAPPGRAAAGLFDQASASSDTFVRQNQRLQSRISGYSAVLADRAQRTLGIGIAGTSVILGVGLMLPVLAIGLTLRWTSAPLHGITTTVRGRALGDLDVRATAAGPADVQELARSVNFLADESNRLTSVREASTRIYEHLHAPAIISEAVAALEENLAVDFAWLALVKGEELHSPVAEPAQDGAPGTSPVQPAYSLGWVRDLFSQRSSYCCQDLSSGIPANLPPQVQDMARDSNAASLLLTPFGTGRELMGALTLVRNKGRLSWTEPEIEAVQSLARDLGRALEHARLYEGEARHVAELQSLDQAKTRFLASASHDLRTPLTNIIGNVEVIQDAEAGPVTTMQASMLDAVSRNGRRLLSLIEDMLTISMIELGEFSSTLCPVDLARLVPEPVDLVMPSMRAGEITFDVRAPREGLMVNGDAGQLGRVLTNLLTNAVKYTPQGGRVTCTAAVEDDDAVLVVQDTGMGIPEDELESLGIPFFRASNVVRREIQGSGLGLSIVRTVVGQHHGKLELESVEGAGTTVKVRIPLLHPGTLSGAARTRQEVP